MKKIFATCMSVVLLNASVSFGQDSEATSATTCKNAALKVAVGLSQIESEIYENQHAEGGKVSLHVPASWSAELESNTSVVVEEDVTMAQEVYVVTNENASGSVISTYRIAVLNQTKNVEGTGDKAFCTLISTLTNI